MRVTAKIASGWLAVLGLVLLAGLAQAAVVSKEVDYTGGGTTMKGYIAWDDTLKGKRPGVLVVHEWWGHNEYARSRARQLAELGYIAMAIDMYGDGRKADHPDNAMAFMQEATKDPERAAARFTAAENRLKAEEFTDDDRIAAIGYCFGGAVVLNMARRGGDLKGVASFHGALGAWAPAKRGAVKARLLVLNGAADTMVPPDAVKKFRDEMTAAGADFRVVDYPDARHAFTNPAADDYAKRFNMPIAYDPVADKASWGELVIFLRELFGRTQLSSVQIRY